MEMGYKTWNFSEKTVAIIYLFCYNDSQIKMKGDRVSEETNCQLADCFGVAG